MWTEERLAAAVSETPQLCVLLLSRDTDGAWLVETLTENGSRVPCRKARDEKAALRRMAEIHRKTADNNRPVTVAHTDVFTAAFLAGKLGKDTSFEPLDPAIGTLALLYSGSLRSSPLV